MNKPNKVSYILLCYNQEAYVQEAVRSALLQSYSPMEILISDDCSTDDTYNIICRECNKYKGVNTVLTNRNGATLGIVRHFNKTIDMTNGDLIIVAAGDDISHSDRTKKNVALWRNKKPLVIGCNPIIIDQNGKTIGHFYSRTIPVSFSWQAIILRRNAALFQSAIDRELFNEWGLLDESLLMEDQTIPFRASLMYPNAITVIDEPLVQYRLHDRSFVSNYLYQTPGISRHQIFINKLRSQIKSHQSWHDDLNTADYKHIDNLDKTKFMGLLKNRIFFFTTLIKIVCTKSPSKRIGLWCRSRKAKIATPYQLFSLSAAAFFPRLTVFLVSKYFLLKHVSKRKGRGY